MKNEILSLPINRLKEAVTEHTAALDRQTRTLDQAITAAARVGLWAKAAVVIAGTALVIQIIGTLLR